MLKVRGHHLLCLHGFRGFGYSPGFVSNMQAILDELRETQGVMIQVTDSPDAICAACPYLLGEACMRDSDGNGISSKDKEVLRRLSLAPGDFAMAGEVFARTAEAFAGRLNELCSECSWYVLGFCAEGIRKKALSSKEMDS